MTSGAALALLASLPGSFTLPNGLRVVLAPDPGASLVAVNLTYGVGSKDEQPGRSGLAHLFEHLMFMGTRRVPNGRFDRAMEAEGGTNNASTSEDRTSYTESGPPHLLDTFLWLEADRMETLGRDLDVGKLDLQRAVVRSERRETVVDTSFGLTDEALNRLLFPKNHPYAHSVIGSTVDLDRASLAETRAFFARYYVPANATLVISGQFDPTSARRSVMARMGGVPASPAPLPPAPPSVPRRPVRRVELTDRVAHPRLTVAWSTAPQGSDDDIALDLAADLLTEGYTSALYDRLVVRDGLARDVVATHESRRYGGVFSIRADLAAGRSGARLEAALVDELSRFRPSEGALRRSRTVYAAARLRDRAGAEGLASAIQNEIARGRPALEGLAAITPARVREAVLRWIAPRHRLNVWTRPGRTPEDPPPPARRPLAAGKGGEEPPVGPPEAPSAPVPLRRTLRDGTPVLVFVRPGAETAALRAVFPGAGAGRDPKGRLGLASVAVEALERGAGARDTEQFSIALEAIGCAFDGEADDANATLAIDGPATSLERAAGLLFDAALAPRLQKDETAYVRRMAATDLEDEAFDDAAVARRVAAAAFYGRGTAEGAGPTGRLADVRAITPPEVERWWRVRVRPVRPLLVLASPQSVGAAVAQLDRALGARKFGTVVPPGDRPVAPLAPVARRLLVARPDSGTVTYLAALPAPVEGPDSVGERAVVRVLGGSFTSRMNASLREREGLTYGARAELESSRRRGWLAAQVAVPNAGARRGLNVFWFELQRTRMLGFSAEEARKGGRLELAAGLAEMDTPVGLVALTARRLALGRSPEGIVEEWRLALALRPDDLRLAAVRLLGGGRDPVLVAVGDPRVIRREAYAIRWTVVEP